MEITLFYHIDGMACANLKESDAQVVLNLDWPSAPKAQSKYSTSADNQ